jgi:hypothetical protein
VLHCSKVPPPVREYFQLDIERTKKATSGRARERLARGSSHSFNAVAYDYVLWYFYVYETMVVVTIEYDYVLWYWYVYETMVVVTTEYDYVLWYWYVYETIVVVTMVFV